MSRKRSLIREYFRIDPNDDKKLYALLAASLSVTEELLLENLWYHLQQVHIAKFEELEL